MKKFVTALVVASGFVVLPMTASAQDGYYCPPGAKFCPPPPGNVVAAGPMQGHNQGPFGQMAPAPTPYGQPPRGPEPRVAYREPNRNYFESQLNEGETLIMVSPGGGPVDGLTPGAIYMGPPADYDMGPMATNYMRQPPPPAPVQEEVRYYPLDVYTPQGGQPYQSAPAPIQNYSPVPVQTGYAMAPAPAYMPPPPAYMPPPPGQQRAVMLTPTSQQVPAMATPTMAGRHDMRQSPPYHEAFQDQGRRDERETPSRQAQSAQARNRKMKKAEVISEIANETAQKNRSVRDGKKPEPTENKTPWWKGGFLKKKSDR